VSIQQSFIFYKGNQLQFVFTNIPVLDKALDQLDEKDELNKKLQEERKLTEEQIKMLNSIEASGDTNYKTYNEGVYKPIIQSIISKYESRPEDKKFSYPNYILPKKFFVTANDIMSNLKKKYWHAPKGTPLSNEMSALELQNLANVVENIANQTQEPGEAMNAYFSKIKNNTFKSAVDNVFNNATQGDINEMAQQNALLQAASGTY
jgi:putative cell wall-binding protein